MHCAYLGFNLYPTSGYKIMPDYFLVWDTNSDKFLIN